MTNVTLAQAPQRSTLTIVAVLMIFIGVIGLLLGLFVPAILAGTAYMISGAIVLVGGVLVWALAALGTWWQFESRQQMGLLARGLGEALDRDR